MTDPASRASEKYWIPAFAGMTLKKEFQTFYENIKFVIQLIYEVT